MKLTPSSSFAPYPDLSSHHGYQAHRNAQSEARPAVLASGRIVCLRECLKNRFLFVHWNADACVRNRKVQEATAFGLALHFNFQRNLSLIGELDCIAQKVHDYLPQTAEISGNYLRHFGSYLA